MAGSMKLLIRPCTAYAIARCRQPQLLSLANKSFLIHICKPQNAAFQPLAQLVQKRGSLRKNGDVRCFSSEGNSNHHHISEAGSIDSSLMQSMQNKIRDELNAESVVVQDAYGDGRHVSIDVVSSVFEGQSAVNRQRMVYKAIWEELQTTVHAVDQMTTRTPSEAGLSK